MISINEILMGRATFESLPLDVQTNITELHKRINVIRAAYGKPMRVNDGYRRPQDTPKNGAAKSKHLTGQAIDIDDDDKGTLWFWLMQPQQMQLLQQVGLWLEHGCYTHCAAGSWVHAQIVPPLSGKRIFIPSSAPNPNTKFWSGKYNPKYDKDLS